MINHNSLVSSGYVHGYNKASKDMRTVIDDIKLEIKELRDSWEKDGYHDEAEALNTALKIIDKHIGKAESEEE